MTHIALAGGVLFWFLVSLTLLLVMFIGAVIVAPPAGPAPTHARAPEPSAPEPPAPDPGGRPGSHQSRHSQPAGWPPMLVRWSRAPPHRRHGHPRPSPPANRRRGCRGPWGSPGKPSPVSP